jgi:hypothetical protein
MNQHESPNCDCHNTQRTIGIPLFVILKKEKHKGSQR